MPCLLKTEARRGDPPEIYNSNVYLLVAISTMGGMIFGYDIGSIGGVIEMKSFKISFGLLNNNRGELASLIAKIVSILQVGCLFGALSTGVMADRIGRKRGLIVASIIFLTGSIIQTTSDGHLGLLYAGRFIGGIGVGQCSMITPLYTSECVPRAIRGKFTGCYQLNIAFGIMVAFW
ncbi:Quinate permease [Neolecta irregularis DAH-3]|uniref:Quinate permease n=1 Tax=Neolecta irregularis (strain DAH-3) TaxID=1198029 RepID=A0A1U7LP76_NEOID|nr:Quinate permease [Neolecta irregularis DAH-3]|eukprot:OLL24439.1 Quinate permease [Neolecta irregularis DAH-3]